MTLAYKAGSREEVLSVFERVKAAGANIVKDPQENFWVGFSGYFVDPDSYHWEVAWGTGFDFGEGSSLPFKA
jgi:uncharacterized glyoxalase superfamily protein PhnB